MEMQFHAPLLLLVHKAILSDIYTWAILIYAHMMQQYFPRRLSCCVSAKSDRYPLERDCRIVACRAGSVNS
jgi:hypothetical protein